MSAAMSKEEREAFLADLHVGIVSIAREGRGPLTVPIWYDYEPGGDVWMLTSPSSLKGKALEGVTRISLCAQTEDPPYKYVSVEGDYAISEATPEHLLSMAVRYLGEEMGQAYAANSQGDDSVIVSLKTDKWLTVDYSKVMG